MPEGLLARDDSLLVVIDLQPCPSSGGGGIGRADDGGG
jgi:hypothetical protein